MVRHIDDATYERLPDEELQGQTVWVIMVHHKPKSDPTYTRSQLYVDKQRNVPLRTRHWDDADVEVKQLDIPRERLELYADVWIPMESTMFDLSEKTSSELYVERVIANPEIEDTLFSPQKLPNLEKAASGAGANQQGG